MPFYVPQRYIVCALCSLAFAILAYKNFCFYAVAYIVSSMEPIDKPPEGEGCPYYYFGDLWRKKSLEITLPVLYWNPHLFSVEDASFHVGKLMMLLPAGVLSDIGYSKSVLLSGMLILAVNHLLRPVIVDLGILVKAFQNLLEGMGDGTLLPSIATIIGRWTPPRERNLYTALMVSGIFYGNCLGVVLFDQVYIGTSSWDFGHYITGVFIIVWVVISYIFIYHSPEESPFVSNHEFHVVIHPRRKSSSSIVAIIYKLQTIPWYKIITSRAFISLLLLFCAVDWAAELNIDSIVQPYQALILHLPEHFTKVSTSSVIITIPAQIFGGAFADWVIRNNFMSKTAIKKRIILVSLVLSSGFLVASCFSGCNVVLFWVLCNVGVYALGLGTPLVYSATIDLSLRHAGVLMSLMSAARTICSLFDNQIMNLLGDNYNVAQWRVRAVFCAMLVFVLAIPFIFFGSLERQHWRTRTPRARPIVPEVRQEEPDTNTTSGEPDTN